MINKENAKDKLFELRCKHGKTQEQVAEGSGVARATINRIEKGVTLQDSLRAVTFYKLNQYFKKLGQ